MPVPVLRAASGDLPGHIPDPFPGLANSRYRARFRRGQLAMLAGPPGAGKTLIALVAALRANVPTLYVSADSDELTMAARVAAATSGHDVATVEEVIKYGLYSDEYGAGVSALPIRFAFEPAEPSVEDLAHALSAWVEINGTAPQLVVVDNLMNMRTGDANEWQGLRQACKDLHWLARTSKACVLVLHHTSEQDPGFITSAPPRRAIQGKVSQLPALILATANDQGVSWLAVVKNRHGGEDPHAREPLRWIIDFGRCQIHDRPLRETIHGG